MALFLGTIANKLDRKGRVSVPASFRAALSGHSFAGIVAYRSFLLPCIEGCGMTRFEDMSAQLGTLEQFSEAYDDLASIFADAQQLAFDGEGRVMLPPTLVAHARLGETVAFVGQAHTFQIWDPEIFEGHQAKVRERARVKGRTLPPLGRPQPQPLAPQPQAIFEAQP